MIRLVRLLLAALLVVVAFELTGCVGGAELHGAAQCIAKKISRTCAPECLRCVCGAVNQCVTSEALKCLAAPPQKK